MRAALSAGGVGLGTYVVHLGVRILRDANERAGEDPTFGLASGFHAAGGAAVTLGGAAMIGLFAYELLRIIDMRRRGRW